MRIFPIAFVLAAATLLLTAAVGGMSVPGAASAASSCEAGFTLVQGGVPETDSNGDGQTCEVLIDDGSTLVAIDNGPAAPATGVCPDHFQGPFPVGFAFPRADRNSNGFVCLKEVDDKVIAIDDNANPNADRS
jgi:hypothetical protein